MRDRFYGKTWIYWVQLVTCGSLVLFCVILGPLFWMGILTDRNGEVAPQVGPPMIIMGCCFLAVHMLALFNIAGRISPIIRCYREGIECNLVGATSLDGVPFIRLVRLAWTILSFGGFRSRRMRVGWPEFAEAQMGGDPMAYVLTLSGGFVNVKNRRVMHSISFKQAAFRDHPKQVMDVLNGFASNSADRESLPSWPEVSPERSTATAAGPNI